jgi:hypothetical protein
MESAIDYREFAAKCLRLAEAMSSPLDRATLVRMAEIWHRMAEEKERAEPQTQTEL